MFLIFTSLSQDEMMLLVENVGCLAEPVLPSSCAGCAAKFSSLQWAASELTCPPIKRVTFLSLIIYRSIKVFCKYILLVIVSEN